MPVVGEEGVCGLEEGAKAVGGGTVAPLKASIPSWARAATRWPHIRWTEPECSRVQPSVCWMPLHVPRPHRTPEALPPPLGSTARATAPSPGRPTPGVVKQDKSSGGSVDTTKTRSGPQRVRMSSGERPIGAAKGNPPPGHGAEGPCPVPCRAAAAASPAALHPSPACPRLCTSRHPLPLAAAGPVLHPPLQGP